MFTKGDRGLGYYTDINGASRAAAKGDEDDEDEDLHDQADDESDAESDDDEGNEEDNDAAAADDDFLQSILALRAQSDGAGPADAAIEDEELDSDLEDVDYQGQDGKDDSNESNDSDESDGSDDGEDDEDNDEVDADADDDDDDNSEDSDEDEDGDGDEDEDGDGDGERDEELNAEGITLTTKAAYIKRSEAFGDNVITDDGIVAAPAAYVPPARRRLGEDGDSGKLERARRHVKGLLNRLNEANLIAIIKDLEMVFRRNSRTETAATLSSFVIEACMHEKKTLQHLLLVYAGAVCALHHLIGLEVSAQFLQLLAENFDAHYKQRAKIADDSDGAAVAKQCTNLATLLCYLYNFKVVHSSVLVDLMQTLAGSAQELDLEVIMACCNTSANRLRNDDVDGLRAVVAAVDAACATSTRPRIKWMVETIGQAKHLKKIKGGTANTGGENFVRLSKAIRSFVTQRQQITAEPLRIPWADLLEAKSRGRWWLVGSAWVGRGKSAASAPGAAASGGGRALEGAGELDGELGGDGGPSDELLNLATSQRMNTSVRKQIFCVMMGSEDYLDAFEKLLRIKLRDKQDREIVRVLCENCIQERAYNAFYGYLGAKLCHHNHNHKITFQFAFWDRFKNLEAFAVPQIANLARLLSHLVADGALSLTVLKVVEFNSLSRRGLLHFQLLLVYLLTNFDDEATERMLKRLATNIQMGDLKSSLLVFIRHYVRSFTMGIGDGGDEACSTPARKKQLLAARIKLAKRWLTRAVGSGPSE